MVYMKLYVYSWSRAASSPYVRGGYRRTFLVSKKSDPSFIELVSRIPEEKPLYTLVADKDNIGEGDLECVLEYSGKLSKNDDIILIPCGMNNIHLPMYSVGDSHDMIRTGVVVTKALMFSSGNTKGYVDKNLIENPLDLLKNQDITVSLGSVANVSEVAASLWNARNKVSVIGKGVTESEIERIKQLTPKKRRKANVTK